MQEPRDTPPSPSGGDIMDNIDEEINYFEEVEEIFSDNENMELQEDSSEEEFTAVEPVKDDAVMVFSEHSGSIFCCDLHPDGKIAVTGGEDDKAYVWCVETGQVLMKCEGYTDSVTFAGFSYDGKYLFAADMCGSIKIWECNTDKTQKQPWTMVFEFEAGEIVWAQWHFGDRVLIAGGDNGDIYIIMAPSGHMKILFGHNKRYKAECGKVFRDGVRLAAGYTDGTFKIWNMKTATVLHAIEANGDSDVIRGIDIHPGCGLVATICPTGRAELILSHNAKVVAEFDLPRGLETVAFSDLKVGLVAFGTLCGAVIVWDIARHTEHEHSRELFDIARGATKMFWIKDQLVTGCLDGSVRVSQGKCGRLNHIFRGHTSEILDLCYNAKQNIFLSASNDGTARIFKYEEESDNE